jgi:hypothetical protein
MGAIKQATILMIFFLLINGAFAYQESLKEFGFSELSNTEKYTKKCTTLTFAVPEEFRAEKGAPILSIRAEFVGNESDSSHLSLKLGDKEEIILWPESFICTTNCWARVFVEESKTNTVQAVICASLGGATSEVKVLESSYFGLYDTPVLSIKNSAPNIIELGDRAKMSIIVSNTGTKKSRVFVQFVHPNTRANVQIASFDIVEGESSATYTIEPNKTKEFIYYIKPTLISAYNLPSAALFFTNIFGEEQVIISNNPQTTVVKPEQIEITLIALNEESPYSFKAIIKNNLPSQFNGNIILSPQVNIDAPVQTLSVAPNSEKEISFTTKELAQGNYAFLASIRDANSIYSSNTISLEVKEKQIPAEIIFVIMGAVIAIFVFVWIYLIKEK